MTPADLRALVEYNPKLRAEASRGPVPSREVFNLTDPLMDAISRSVLASAKRFKGA